MLSGWRHDREARAGQGDGGWGPPHPPPEPLISFSQPENGPVEPRAGLTKPSGGLKERSRKPRGAAARTLALIGAAALGAVALVVLAVLVTGLPSSGHHQAQRLARASGTRTTHPFARPTVPTTTTNTDAASRSTLGAVNAVIDETGSGRQKVVSTINSVQSCSMSPSDGQAVISNVVSDRQQALDQLRRLAQSAQATPTDRSVIQSLISVLNDSMEADRAYGAWMADMAAGQQNCGTDPSGDANFTAGQTFSEKADGDKVVFVDAWNPLAGREGLATYQPQDF